MKTTDKDKFGSFKSNKYTLENSVKGQRKERKNRVCKCKLVYYSFVRDIFVYMLLHRLKGGILQKNQKINISGDLCSACSKDV